MQIIRNIAIYGGAFDPPHLMHEQIANSLLKIDFIDEVWLLPCGDRNDKKLLLTTYDRFKLLEKIFINNKKIHISDIEIKLCQNKNHQMIPTNQLLNYLKKNRINNHLFLNNKDNNNNNNIFENEQIIRYNFVIGSDNLKSIQKWQQYQQLKNNNYFIIFPRNGYPIQNHLLPQKHYIYPQQMQFMSSSYLKNIFSNLEITIQKKIIIAEKFLSKEVLNFLIQSKIIQ